VPPPSPVHDVLFVNRSWHVPHTSSKIIPGFNSQTENSENTRDSSGEKHQRVKILFNYRIKLKMKLKQD
jgi:hypothetical protein